MNFLEQRRLEQLKAQHAATLERQRIDAANRLEQYRATNAADLEEYKANQQLWRAAVYFGRDALRSLLLINGAAAIALLAFAGRLYGDEDPARVAVARDIASALMMFGWGVSAATAAAAGSYLSQVLYVELTRPWPGHVLRGMAVLLGAAALGLFIVGCNEAANALRSN